MWQRSAVFLFLMGAYWPRVASELLILIANIFIKVQVQVSLSKAKTDI